MRRDQTSHPPGKTKVSNARGMPGKWDDDEASISDTSCDNLTGFVDQIFHLLIRKWLFAKLGLVGKEDTL